MHLATPTTSSISCVAVAHPRSLSELTELLRDEENTVLLAGGTDFMVGLNHGSTRLGIDDLIVDLRSVAELSTFEIDYQQRVLRLGAGVRWDDLLTEPIANVAPCLSQSARTVGSHQIRTAGTIGGNLATASPAGDGVCALVALDATLVLTSSRGQRTVAVSDFAIAPKKNVLERDEFIERIDIPITDGWQGYSKIGTRNAMVISVAGVAVVLSSDNNSCRIALGSVGPTIIFSNEASRYASDSIDWSAASISPTDLDRVGHLARESASPIDDHRSTAAYRTHAVGVLTTRLIKQGLIRMRESQ
jgi:CO/xanthine dehydrogenase FAD-binding subunit